MKKSLLILALTLASTGTSFGYYGTFGFGIELTGTGAGATNNGVTTLYALDQTDNGDLLPTTSPKGMLSVAWTTASTEGTPTFNLGTFTTGDTLVLNGGSLLTYQGTDSGATSSDVVSSATLNYEVATGPGSGTFPNLSLPVNATNFGNTGNIRWATEANTTNLLAGLTPGTYVLSVYGSGTTALAAGGTAGFGDTNNGANWGATFTVVPEPGTVSLLLFGLGLLLLSQRELIRSMWNQAKLRLH